MKLAMQLTLDGLVRTLRQSADRLADEIERNGPGQGDVSFGQPRRPREPRSRSPQEDDDERTRP